MSLQIALEHMYDSASMEPNHALELLHTLAHLVNDGAAYELRTEMRGSGTGVSSGRLRVVVEVDQALFWRRHAELASVREQRRKRRDGES